MFEISEDFKLLQQSVRDFVENEVEPVAMEIILY